MHIKKIIFLVVFLICLALWSLTSYVNKKDAIKWLHSVDARIGFDEERGSPKTLDDYRVEIFGEERILHVNLYGPEITDIDRLKSLRFIESLDLFETNIDSLEVLSELENLEELRLGGTPLNRDE